ncbi:TetR/AcrR family transcriptional regulator [Geodermatophilus sp. SYSU D00697]
MADRTDGVSRRAQIIDVAARLFEQRGYHETSMEVLAQEVGIRKASLYYYFSNKDLILVEIHEEMIDHLLVRARERAGSPVERLDGIVFDLVSLMELYPGRLRIFFEHYRELPAEQRRGITVKRDEYQGLLLATLRDGVADGSFVIEDVEVAALAILGMCNWTYQWLRPGGALSARQVADRFLTLVLQGIRAPSTVPGR